MVSTGKKNSTRENIRMCENLNCTLLKINLHLPCKKTFIILTDNKNFNKTIFNRLESKIMLRIKLSLSKYIQNKYYIRHI